MFEGELKCRSMTREQIADLYNRLTGDPLGQTRARTEEVLQRLDRLIDFYRAGDLLPEEEELDDWFARWLSALARLDTVLQQSNRMLTRWHIAVEREKREEGSVESAKCKNERIARLDELLKRRSSPGKAI